MLLLPYSADSIIARRAAERARMTEAVSTPSRRLPPADVLAGSMAQLIAALAETLKSRGLTQVRAAQLCGTDQPTLSKVLTGRSDWSPSTS